MSTSQLDTLSSTIEKLAKIPKRIEQVMNKDDIVEEGQKLRTSIDTQIAVLNEKLLKIHASLSNF
jgi:hypothetical protein